MVDSARAENSFSILGVSPRTNLGGIEERIEDLLVDFPDREEEYLAIRQELITPKSRLMAELTYPSDMSPTRAAKALKTINAENESEVLSLLDEAPPLSSVNLASAAFDRLTNIRVLAALFRGHIQLVQDKLLDQLNATRAAAGFPAIQDEQLKQGLRILRETHAKSAVKALTRTPNGMEVLADGLVDVPDALHPFVSEMVRQYDHWSSPLLNDVRTKLEAHIAAALEPNGQISNLTELLAQWKILSRPAQVHARRSGIDEERTRRIYYDLRGACLNLANDQSRYSDALNLSISMLEQFSDLPTAKAQLDDDIQQLRELSREQDIVGKAEPLRRELIRLFDQARAQTRGTDLSEAGRGAYATFRPQLMSLLGRDGLAGEATRLVHQFAVQLTNELHRPKASVAILELLQADLNAAGCPAHPLVERDLLVGRRNVLSGDLQAAVARQDWAAAEAYAARLAAMSETQEERGELLRVQSLARQRLDNARNSRTGWFVVAAVIGLVFVVGQCAQAGSDDRSPSYGTYDPPSTQTGSYPGATEGPAETTGDDIEQPAIIDPEPTPTNPESETPRYLRYGSWVAVPPVGTGLELTADEVRYCEFESSYVEEIRLALEARLYSAPTGVANGAIDQFNLAVEDYNRRCSSYRFVDGDQQAARQAASAAGSQIRSDAQYTVSEWVR